MRPLTTRARGAGVRKCRGGGFLKDPSYGVADGADTIGFDCSNLMAYAFYNGSGGKIRIVPPAKNFRNVGTHVTSKALGGAHRGNKYVQETSSYSNTLAAAGTTPPYMWETNRSSKHPNLANPYTKQQSTPPGGLTPPGK